jgi:sphinganine-1-phosphate aldolase
MTLPHRIADETALFDRIEAFRAGDLTWRDGRTWALVYGVPEDVERVGKRAYMAFLSENGLDPTVFPSVMQMENEVVAIALGHLSAPDGAVGNFTTGGTESCMMAVKAARDRAKALKGITEPELILPVTAHAAFHKACEYFGVKKVLVPVDPVTFRADVDAMEAAITPNTIQMVGSAVSYAHGVVDPIEELGQLALKHDILLHVDGCIGAFLLPLFAELGADVPPFDFDVPGVTSISMDLHKYGFCPKPSSVILYRTMELRRYQIFSCADWTGYTVVNPTFLSSRSGGPVAASWAVLHYIGREGYLDFARGMLDGTRRVIAGIEAIDGLRILGTPETNLIAFASDELPIFRIADAMKDRGWYVQPQLGFHGSPANIHLSVNPDCLKWTDDLLRDLAECTAAVEVPEATGPDLGAMLAGVDPKAIDEATFAGILGMAGIQGGKLPEHMAEINELLDSLPPQFTQEMLREFLNQLYVPASLNA